MLRIALLSSIALCSLALATAATAQSDPAADQPPSEASVDPATEPETTTPATAQDDGTIVITGSRIARQDYVSTSPIITEATRAVVTAALEIALMLAIAHGAARHAAAQPAAAAELADFTSDGCSLFPEGSHYGCCYVHDVAYWPGGTADARDA